MEVGLISFFLVVSVGTFVALRTEKEWHTAESFPTWFVISCKDNSERARGNETC